MSYVLVVEEWNHYLDLNNYQDSDVSETHEIYGETIQEAIDNLSEFICTHEMAREFESASLGRKAYEYSDFVVRGIYRDSDLSISVDDIEDAVRNSDIFTKKVSSIELARVQKNKSNTSKRKKSIRDEINRLNDELNKLGG